MQPITPVTTDQLLASGQQPKAKFEIYVDPYWVNICDGFSFLLSTCDATTDWSASAGGSLSIDTSDKKEGTGSLKDTVAEPEVDIYYATIYGPAGSWNWSAKKHILFWLKSDRANAAFSAVQLRIYDTLNNYSYWNLTFSAGEWTAVKKLLSTPDGTPGTPPDLALINNVQIRFFAADTTPFYKKIDDLRVDDVEAGLKGKNYLEDWSISLGGASMTPNPVGGTWNVTLSNENGIFHPKHPTSAYKDYLVTGRKARLSIGGKYGGTDYYWQRIIGHMDEPSFDITGAKINISGGDYMKFLQDTELKSPDNYWGASQTFNSIASDGLAGAELYNEVDAMDINNEANNVAGWGVYCGSFISMADDGGGSVYVGKAIITVAEDPYIFNSIFTPEANTQYRFQFEYRRVTGTGWGNMRVIIYQNNGVTDVELARKENLRNTGFTAVITENINDKIDFKEGAGSELNIVLDAKTYTPDQLCAEIKEKMEWVGDLTYTVSYSTVTGKFTIAASGEFSLLWKTGINGSDNTDEHIGTTLGYDDSADDTGASSYEADNSKTYTQEEIYFTSQGTQAIQIWIEWYDFEVNVEFRVDQFSFFKFIPYEERYYQLPAECKRPYRVILDSADVWEGEQDEGWLYEESTRRVAFNLNKTVAIGTDNLIIYYFTTQAIEDVLADLLVTAGLYADRASALADMNYTPPGINIDQVWFDAGKSALDAIRMICERLDYRFFFNYNGKPDFNPKPSPGATVFTFTDQKHIASPRRYEDRAEILNRIVIEGKKRAEPVNREESLSSELRGEASDATSITAYGERTKTIKNPLFQTQASIDAMCTTLLAEYKDAKWYCSISVPYNPVPLEFCDDIQWKERLSPTLEITETGFTRDIKISKFDTIYICETT